MQDGEPADGRRDAAALRGIAILQGAEPGVLVALLARARWRNAVPGELILDFGDPSEDVFFVCSGMVQVLLRTSEGREFLFGEVRQGGFFGEMAAIDGKSRSANVTASTAVHLCIVPGSTFLSAVLASPPLCLKLLRLMSQRLRENGERLLEIATLPIRQRLAATLLRLARPRESESGTMILSPPPTHQMLAVLIGARREAVSREMVGMMKDGLIETTRRSIVIRQVDLLRKRSGTSRKPPGSRKE
ncbi:MAG: cyclic nucleotide-binding protein [Roseomonas sp.]|jgi:CRP/FNR family cyclic AMP-dependent transcriptional regulator|nr:cyclic nucleotide-binding protein [Roseomonas sp.]